VPESLFTEDERYTEEALIMSLDFQSLTKEFIADNPGYRLRELESVLTGAVRQFVLTAILRRQLMKDSS
jgi:hypothetical protein